MIADAKKRRIGHELVDWIYLGIRTGARRSVAEYQRLKATDPTLAEGHLKRAVNMPLRARARINQARDDYEAVNGAGTFNAFIASCLGLAGTVTLSEINGELTTMENYANNLLAAKRAGTTLDQIAADIEAKIEHEALAWQFPLPAAYEDQW